MATQPSTRSQTTSHLLLVRPASFGFNQETALDNVFQVVPGFDINTIQAEALQEFNQFVNHLERHKIDVIVIEDNESLKTTDAVFPNNWISFHEDGTVCIYPMLSTVRRRERRLEILDKLRKRFLIGRIVDLTSFENHDKFLEGTGSLILDRVHNIAYMCHSKRSDQDVLQAFAKELQSYNKCVVFEAVDFDGQPIYHTNVVMCLGKDFAVICLEAIKCAEQRTLVVSTLQSTGKRIVEISMSQMYNFAGNMLQVHNEDGDWFLIMSTRAFKCLTSDQVIQLEWFNQKILHSDLATIEEVGGGSARCMMAEIFLPLISNNLYQVRM